MIFQHKLVQSTQKNCASPAVTVPMAKSAIFGPKRAKSIFPKFSKIQVIFFPLLRPFNPFGRRHEARGREIRRGFESSVQSLSRRVESQDEFTHSSKILNLLILRKFVKFHK